MTIDINWLSVILATFIGTGIAGFWYSKFGLGNLWRQLTGVKEKDSKKAGNAPLVVLLIANFITALTLDGSIAITQRYFNDSSTWLALLTSLIAWLAFSATTLMTHNGFELKSPRLTLLNNSYQLVLFLGMAFVIGLF
jgi:hypothetical protein